jgi:anti-sigma factor RsiW
MTLSRESMLELMAYADGELEETERARVEALIASDPDAKRLVESIGVLGGVVERIHDASHGASLDGLADAIMARVEKEGAPRRASIRPPRVIDLRDARENRLKVAGAIVAAIALAAGIVLTTRKANQDSPFQASHIQPHVTTPATPGTAPGPAPVPDTQVAAAGVDVDQVDSKHDVEVFYLPSSVGKNASSVVVWIDDTGPGK